MPVYVLGEVMHSDISIVSEYQTKGHLDGLLDYPLQYELLNVFTKAMPMQILREQYIKERAAFRDLDSMGVFIDNHDVRRIFNIL